MTYVFCEQCGSALEPDDVFCTNCGTRAPKHEPPSAVPVGGKFCPKCGAPIESGDVYCITCGLKIPLTATPATVGEVQGTDASGRSSQIADTPGGAVHIEGIGNAEVAANHAGTVLADSVPTGFCVSCGGALYTGDTFCPACGESIGVVPRTTVPAEEAKYMVPPTPAATMLVSAPLVDDDDEPYVLTKLVTITRDEAREGCTKSVELDDGMMVDVDVPAGSNPGTKVDVAGYGLKDERTGLRGPLRVSFYIVR